MAMKILRGLRFDLQANLFVRTLLFISQAATAPLVLLVLQEQRDLIARSSLEFVQVLGRLLAGILAIRCDSDVAA